MILLIFFLSTQNHRPRINIWLQWNWQYVCFDLSWRRDSSINILGGWWMVILTRLHGLWSTVVDEDTADPLLKLFCGSWIGFIGGGNSNVVSSSASWSLPLAADADAVGCADTVGSVFAVIVSLPFLMSADEAAAFVLSTFPWDNFRSGGGNHFRLQKTTTKNILVKIRSKFLVICSSEGIILCHETASG